MRALFRTLTPPIELEILDMIEEGDRVAVRWQLTATYEGRPFEQSIMAIYRFEKGASPRIGASRSGHFGREARRRTENSHSGFRRDACRTLFGGLRSP